MNELKLLRRKQVAALLGIGRHALARLVAKDPTFPRFFSITPGTDVLSEADLRNWIEQKRLASRIAQIAPNESA
jgi:predicted DNA-binding transcriptional regulator AlpA